MSARYKPDPLPAEQGGRQPYGPDNLPRLPEQVRRAVHEWEYLSASGMVRRLGKEGRILAQFFRVFPPRGSIAINKRYRRYPSEATMSRAESQGEFWERARFTVLKFHPGASWEEVTMFLIAWRFAENPRLPDGLISPRIASTARKKLLAFLARQ